LHLWLRERMMKKKIKELVSQDKEGGFGVAWNLYAFPVYNLNCLKQIV
jgi:hypothetical protein